MASDARLGVVQFERGTRPSTTPVSIVERVLPYFQFSIVSRPRVWKEAQVLDAAMVLFRAKGFERTSLRDVEAATGLHNGSLYKAYGSKAGLFNAVLGAYNDRVVCGRIEQHLARTVDPVMALTAFFTSTYEDRPTPDPGCLLTNSAVESPALSDDARRAVAGGLQAIRVAFEDVVARGQATGQVARDAEARPLAERLLALYQGLLVLVRLGRPADELTAIPAAIPGIIGHTQTRRST